MKEASAAGRLQDEFEVRTHEALLQLYGEPAEASLRKEVDYLHPLYQRYVQASPFVALATRGPDGLDVSPRGDPAGFVQVLDEKTLLLPDRRGNKRIDSLRNILHDPRVALLFLIPGAERPCGSMGGRSFPPIRSGWSDLPSATPSLSAS